MIITHIVSSLNSSQGGPPKVVLDFAKYQMLNGHNVNIVSQLDENKINNQRGVNLVMGSFLTKRYYIPSLDFILKIYNNIKVSDIIHLHGVWNGVISVSALISRILKKKVVMTPHGSLDSFNVKNKYFFKKLYYYLFEKNNIDYIQAFHFLSKKEFKNSCWVKNINKKKILIQPNGIDLNYLQKLKLRRKKTSSKKKFQITFLGRLNKIKNIDLQIDLIHRLNKKKNNYFLNIIGPNDGSLNKLEKKKNILGLNRNIKFKKPVYGIKKYSIIKNSDIVILTSFYECNSVLAIEVMSLGGVLLCTNNCNLNHASRHCAVKVSDYKLGNLVKSVYYLSNEKNSSLIRKKALKYAKKNLDIKLNIKKILKFYKNIEIN